MANYTGNYQGVTLSTSQDLKTIVTVATGQGASIKVKEIWIAGEAGSSTVARVAVNRPSAIGVTIGANTQVPEKLDPNSPTAGSSPLAGGAATVSSWGTPPVLSTNDVLSPTVNAFGGVVRWVFPPDCELVVGNAGAVANLCIRSRSGTPAVSGHIVYEER